RLGVVCGVVCFFYKKKIKICEKIFKNAFQGNVFLWWGVLWGCFFWGVFLAGLFVGVFFCFWAGGGGGGGGGRPPGRT
ncbi:hypothetical protein ACVGW7_16795, partial [Enterobacter intestinihominis]